MSARRLTKNSLTLWWELAIELGLLAFVMNAAFVVFALGPILLFGNSLLLMVIFLFVLLGGSLAYLVCQCVGFVAVDNHLRTGQSQFGPVFSRLADRSGPILAGMFLLGALGTLVILAIGLSPPETLSGALLNLIPLMALQIFSVVYIPYLALGHSGPIGALLEALRGVVENLPTFLTGIALLFMVAIAGSVAIVGTGVVSVGILAISESTLVIGLSGAILLFSYFVYMPLYWIVGAVLFHEFKASESPASRDHRPDFSPHFDGSTKPEGDSENQSTGRPVTQQLVAPITVEIEGGLFGDPADRTPRRRSAKATPRVDDSSEYLGEPIDFSQYGDDDDYGDR